MVTRRSFVHGAAAAGAATVAACGGAAGGDAVAPSKGPVKLVLLHAWDEARLPLMEKMRDDFQKRYPTVTVDFDLTTTASGMASPRVTKLVASVAGGSPPDVSMIWRGELPALALQGVLQPVDQFISRDKFDPKIYYEAEWQTSRYQNKAYVLPNVSNGAWYANFYNRAHLKEAGYGVDQPPTTFAQATEYLKKLTKLDGSRIVRLGGEVAGGAAGFILWTLNNKGKYLSEDGKKAQFDSAETYEALEWFQGFYEAIGGTPAVSAFNAQYTGATAAQQPFTVGAQSQKIQNPSQIFHIKANNPDIDFGVTVPVHGPKDKEGKSYIRGGWSYGLPSGGKYASEGWLLTRWLSTTKEAAGWFMQQQLRPSPMREVNEDKYYLEKLPVAWPQVLKVMQKDTAVPITPVDAEIDKVLGTAMNDVAAKKGAIRDIVRQAQTDVQRELDTFWARQGK
ncbi:MAG TPA: extracellular solute-binding protein [Chloroflexota bacterium]|nr:extracellular solute-binding protein [Chloroflexota bacterium]